MPKPIRVQLSRARGWRMPPNTVKVDRTTKWGNPFVIGVDGTQEECVRKCEQLLRGSRPASPPSPAQAAYRAMVLTNVAELRGRNLACWCKPGTPCHADLLLELAAR